MKWISVVAFFLQFILFNYTYAKTVKYELTTTNEQINVSGNKTINFALLVNKSLPAPTLEFIEGDDAEITIINKIPKQEVSIHWHGILLPNEMDGVPYVTTPPIPSGTQFVFKFKIRQNGTYWYHSHTDVQEQKGIYGAIVIHPKDKKISYQKDAVAVLSDWSDENATQILKNLKKDGDYYLYKKGTMRSWFGALLEGQFGNFIKNEWSRMGGMDYSDVGYDAFLINGKKESQLGVAKKGEKVRIRLINAAASTYFFVALGDKPVRVISADGIDIKATLSQEILMGMAETYDLLFEVPDNKNYELKITAQDGTGIAKAWIGNPSGEKVFAPVKPMPDQYETMDHDMSAMGGMDHSIMMDHSKHSMGGMDKAMPETPAMDHSMHNMPEVDHSKMIQPKSDMSSKNELIQTLTVDKIQSPIPTEYKNSRKVVEFKLVLGGDMERYVWHINGKAIFEDKTIAVEENDLVRFVFENQTMMHHPMHLHGHFFRVLNQFGAYSPLKHTVDVPPHGTKTIEFFTNEPGQWMLHCHNLFHLKTGMARVVSYESFKPKEEVAVHQKHDPHDHDHLYATSDVLAATNIVRASAKLSQSWQELELSAESLNTSKKPFSFNEKWETDLELMYKRFFASTNYFHLLGGAAYEHEKFYGQAGFFYILPLLVESKVLINHKGRFKLSVEKDFQWTKYISSQFEFVWKPNPIEGEKIEYLGTLMFANDWNWSAGLTLTQDSLGVGVRIRL